MYNLNVAQITSAQTRTVINNMGTLCVKKGTVAENWLLMGDEYLLIAKFLND